MGTRVTRETKKLSV